MAAVLAIEIAIEAAQRRERARGGGPGEALAVALGQPGAKVGGAKASQLVRTWRIAQVSGAKREEAVDVGPIRLDRGACLALFMRQPVQPRRGKSGDLGV